MTRTAMHHGTEYTISLCQFGAQWVNQIKLGGAHVTYAGGGTTKAKAEAAQPMVACNMGGFLDEGEYRPVDLTKDGVQYVMPGFEQVIDETNPQGALF